MEESFIEMNVVDLFLFLINKNTIYMINVLDVSSWIA